MVIYDNRKGLVLVGVLWLKVILVAMVAVLSRSSRLDLKVRAMGIEELRCRWACRAGIEKAVAILNEDTRESDSYADLWSENYEDFNDIPLEGCRFTVQVIDEASKLNINTATKKQLMQLPEMVEEIADAIIDWRDKNDTVSGLGAEGGYYETLPYGYKIRNGRFRTIRELLLVKGVTEELFYGEDTNFNGQLDENEDDGQLTPPNDDADGELDYGWIHYLTCYSYEENVDAEGNKRVNINQGNERSLATALGISRSQAKWIVENRKGGYKSIADLISNNTPKEPKEGPAKNPNAAKPIDLQTFAAIADKITVSNSQKLEGRVNINTASSVVLAALLGGGDAGAQLAEQIVGYREEQLLGLESIADILQFEGMSINTFKKIANYITVRSNVYTVRCFATAERAAGDGLEMLTEAVIDRTDTPYELLYWYQGTNR